MKATWREDTLADVCQFINRGISPTYLDCGGLAVLNQKCVRDHKVSFDLGRRHDVSAKKVTPERLLRAGDVLVNSTGTGTLGRVAQVRSAPPEPTTVDSHVTIVRPADGLFYPDFFGYALVAIEAQIQVGGEGCGKLTGVGRQLRALMLSPFVSQRLTMLISKENSADLERLTELIETGAVTPTIDRIYPLEEAPDAMRHLVAGQARGKIAIAIDSQ